MNVKRLLFTLSLALANNYLLPAAFSERSISDITIGPVSISKYKDFFDPKISAFTILGLIPPVTDSEIKEQFVALSKELHPDRNPENPIDAQQAFNIMKIAYEKIKRSGGERANEELLFRDEIKNLLNFVKTLKKEEALRGTHGASEDKQSLIEQANAAIEQANMSESGKPLMLAIARQLVNLKLKNIPIDFRRVKEIAEQQITKPGYSANFKDTSALEQLARYYFALLPRTIQRRDRAGAVPIELGGPSNFKGISIQDLLDTNAVNADDIVEREYFNTSRSKSWRIVTLDLSNLMINDLKNLAKIPGIYSVNVLDLKGNALTEVKDTDLIELKNLMHLDVRKNPIKRFSEIAFLILELPNLREIGLSETSLSENKIREIIDLTRSYNNSNYDRQVNIF